MMHNEFGSGFGQYGNWLCDPEPLSPAPLAGLSLCFLGGWQN